MESSRQGSACGWSWAAAVVDARRGEGTVWMGITVSHLKVQLSGAPGGAIKQAGKQLHFPELRLLEAPTGDWQRLSGRGGWA